MITKQGGSVQLGLDVAAFHVLPQNTEALIEA